MVAAPGYQSTLDTLFEIQRIKFQFATVRTLVFADQIQEIQSWARTTFLTENGIGNASLLQTLSLDFCCFKKILKSVGNRLLNYYNCNLCLKLNFS